MYLMFFIRLLRVSLFFKLHRLQFLMFDMCYRLTSTQGFIKQNIVIDIDIF